MPPDATKSNTKKLIGDHQRLVYHLVARIHRRLPVRYDREDLIGYGMLGLVEAASSYQPGRGIEFTTYAYPRIHGAIYDGISCMSWMSRARYKRLLKEHGKALEQSQQEETEDVRDIENLDAGMAGMKELDQASSEQLPSKEPTAPSIVAHREIEGVLSLQVDALPHRKKILIIMIYVDDLTLQDAAERLGISKGWASRLHADALKQLAFGMKERC